jgi:predicted nucleotidyltransferase
MDALVERIVRTIVPAIQPEKIILFGSRGAGRTRAESDVDLVVVYRGTKSKREVLLEIRQLFEHPDFSMDLFVLTPEELETQKGIANSLAREITERGVVCYGRG